MQRFQFAAISILWAGTTISHGQVTRAQAMAEAERYLRLEWKGGTANVHHGLDAEGVRVDTPDVGFTRPGLRPGWWTPGIVNQGMPYMWGGFCTVEEFKAGLLAGSMRETCARRKNASVWTPP